MASGGGSGGPTAIHEKEKPVFHRLLWGYVLTTTFALAAYIFVLRAVRRRRPHHAHRRYSRDGLLVLASWPPPVRRWTAMLVFSVVLLPLVLVLMCLLFALILAPLEHWPLFTAFEYAVSNAASLSNPLTSVSPVTLPGKLVDAAVSIIAMLFTTTAMGLAASMAMMSNISESMPQDNAGFLRYMFLYLPALILTLSASFGCIMANLEGWTFLQGFFFMAGSFAGDATPLTEVAPKTAIGNFFDTMSMVVEVTVGGAVIGIVGSHPVLSWHVSLLEGGAAEEVAKTEVSPAHCVHECYGLALPTVEVVEAPGDSSSSGSEDDRDATDGDGSQASTSACAPLTAKKL